jgi:hypothetical protein
MSRGTNIKLSELLLKNAEGVNRSKRPKPLPFTNHAAPDYRHPFEIDDARNVLFVGSGEQFARRISSTMNEVFGRILRFGDTAAWKWQKTHVRERVAKFFGDPRHENRPALLWTGQYCITYWYGVEKLRGPIMDRLLDARFYRGGGAISLGGSADRPKSPKERAATLSFDEKRFLFLPTEVGREHGNGNGLPTNVQRPRAPKERITTIPLGYLDAAPGIPKGRVAAVSFDARRLLFAHPEENEGDRRILLSCSYRRRPTPRKTWLSTRRESIGVVVPDARSDMSWVRLGLNPACTGLVERDGAGLPIFVNACYMLAMRLRPSSNGDAWAEDLLLVLDGRDSRLIEISARVYDFEAFTAQNDAHFAAIIRDYPLDRTTT